jgi:hypothetical protein
MTLRLVERMQARDLLRRSLATDLGAIDGDDEPALRLATLRRAASRLCPCSRRALIEAVTSALRGLLTPEGTARDAVDADIDALVGCGDLVPARHPDDSRPVLYLSPPMFVRRSEATVFLIGGLPEAAVPIPPTLTAHGVYRELTPAPSDQELMDLGLSPFPMEAWMEAPPDRRPADLLAELDQKLGAAPPSGDLRELSIIDNTMRPDYYVGRFLTPSSQSGRYLARRHRKWGGVVWCYVELIEGVPRRLIDLPQIDQRFRGRDEAMWLLCAADALRGQPQSVHVSEAADAITLAFDMPLPMWAERRLLTVGASSDARPRGALLAYRVRVEEAPAELTFLSEKLWMERTEVATREAP